MVITNLRIESVYVENISFVLAIMKLLCASQNG